MTHQIFLDEIKKLDDNGQHLEVVKMITDRMPANPDASCLFHLRAQQLLKMEKYKEGASDAKIAIDLGGGSESHMLHGRLLYCLGKFLESRQAFQKAKDTRECTPNGLDPCVQWLAWCEERIKRLKLDENQQTPEVDSSTTTSTSTATTPLASTPAPIKVRHDWYQTDTHTVITIMLKNAQKEHLIVNIEETILNVSAKLPTGDDYCLNLNLCHPVQPDASSYKIMSSKVEIKLKKQDCIRWQTLEGCGSVPINKLVSVSNNVELKPPSYPTSSTKKKDWDKIEADVIKMEETEKPEGDAALNQLFQKIYMDGSDEVKKAMNKSFSESGGTVLSTNWKEVQSDKVDVKAPDGVEWKKWEK